MHRLTSVFALVIFLAVSGAQAAGLRAFDIPAGPTGPAIRGLVWHPCAQAAQEIDARGGKTFFAVNNCPITGEDKLPLIVIAWPAGMARRSS